MLSLSAKERTSAEKAMDLRKKGFIPAVYYGKKTASTSISVPYTEFKKVFEKAGESTVVTLKTPGGDVDTLIHDIDFDPITGNPRHADFYAFEKGQTMQVSVPLEFIGEAPAIKAGFLVVKVMHEVNVEAEPANLPSNLTVDISHLAEVGNTVTIKDIPEVKGVKFLDNPEDVVASVQAPKEEKEEVPVDLTAIEVEKKGKEAAEGEGEAAEGAEAPEVKEAK